MPSKQHQERYPLAAADLFRVFTDPAFYEARYTSDRTRHEFAELGARGDQFVIDVRQFVKVDPKRVPSLLSKLVRSENVVHTRITWNLKPNADGSYTGTHAFRIEGVPVEVKGSMRLQPAGDAACTNEIKLDISCSIPLIGGKVAGFIADKTTGALDKNYQHTCGYLKNCGLITG